MHASPDADLPPDPDGASRRGSMAEQAGKVTPAADPYVQPISVALHLDGGGPGRQLEIGVDGEFRTRAHALSRVRMRSVPLTRHLACEALSEVSLGTSISRLSAS
mgnify:FL=1